jgi:hypothetical protein
MMNYFYIWGAYMDGVDLEFHARVMAGAVCFGRSRNAAMMAQLLLGAAEMRL